MKKPRELLFIIIPLLIIIQQDGLFSDFILDKDEGKSAEEKDIKKSVETEEKYSKYIARNIKAEVIPDIKGAVRISWDLHRDSDDDYIVGRSLAIPDTMDKALKSVSIKVVPAGAKTEVIDSNLRAGAYYYCVLARSKIMDREIELFAGQNYTINPSMIEEEAYREPEEVFPQQVSLIYVRPVSKNVRITWRGIESSGIIYTIYRGTVPLDSPDRLAQAEKIQTIADGRESYIDTGITKSATYYYAVTTKDIYGNEDLNLIPDQSYSVSGVYVSLGVPVPVSNISTVSINEGVRLSWEKTSPDVSEYLIYRYSSAISDTERIGLSTFLGRVPGNISYYIDGNPEPGNYYYAVLTKFMDSKVLNDLIKGGNYTTEPIVLGTSVQLVSFTASAYDRDVELTWKISGNLGDKNYLILRKESSIHSLSDLKNADLVDNININDLRYIDRELEPGTYYYAIVPKSYENREFSIKPGINVTGSSIVISGRQTAIAEKSADKTQQPIERRIYKKESVSRSRVDEILQKYFLTGRYRYALKLLEDFVERSNNSYDTSKAKLFIGRALIELKNYREAVQYLILKDVNEQYPEEARFWREYAISKISNSGSYDIKDDF